MAIGPERLQELALELARLMGPDSAAPAKAKPKKRKPKLREVPKPKLLEPIGFDDYARNRFTHWNEHGEGGALCPKVRVLRSVYRTWLADHDLEELAHARPDFTALSRSIVSENLKRRPAARSYLRLATVDGVGVQP